MDWTLLVLLAAIAVTYVLWQRARAQVAAARVAAEQAVEVNTFELEPFEDGDVRGFRVVDAEGIVLERLNWVDRGLDLLDVDELAPLSELESGRAFAPGFEVELIPDDAAPDAAESVSVWDTTMTLRCGSIRANQVPALVWRLEHEEVGSCVVLTETRTRGRPVHLSLLLVHRDVDVVIAPQE